MVEYEWQQLRDNPDWVHVLTAYATRAAADRDEHPGTPNQDGSESRTPTDSPEHSAPPPEQAKKSTKTGNEGWVCRLTKVEGVSGNHLSAIHGKLIAFGFLNFELTSRTTGMRYQVTTLGRRILRWLEADARDTDRTSDSDKRAA